MINKLILAGILLLAALEVQSSMRKDSLATLLNLTLQNKTDYELQKQTNIRNIKGLKDVSNLSLEQEYDINFKLYKEYEKYISDSAVYYIDMNEQIARQLESEYLLNETTLYQAAIYSTKGMYIESKNKLDNIITAKLNNDLLINYYHTYTMFYSHYGQSTDVYHYYDKSETYRDSMVMILPKESLVYKIAYAEKLAYGEEFTKPETEEYLLQLLQEQSDTNPERAMIAYLLSEIYRRQGNTEQEQLYLMIAAITDIKNCIKDNASMQSLALTYFDQGQISLAFKFIQEAVDDANFCNVRYRAVEASASYPIIYNLYIEKEKKQKQELQLYLIFISLLTIVLIISILYIYRQVKKVAKTRKELFYSNKSLNVLNAELKKAIGSLQEANHIKEEYIAHFFDLCSNYIDKIEQYQIKLNKMIVGNQTQELVRTIKSNTILENEIEDLYKNFDTIFLSIYPSFIEDFNALLLPNEQLFPKQGELLNTELRIYALIRLGIKDSVKIASFLRYSLRTVYNYRTKMRNKAAGDREEFENLVEKIGYTH